MSTAQLAETARRKRASAHPRPFIGPFLNPLRLTHSGVNPSSVNFGKMAPSIGVIDVNDATLILLSIFMIIGAYIFYGFPL